MIGVGISPCFVVASPTVEETLFVESATLKLALLPTSIESTGGIVTRWRDESGNGYHGTPTGSPTVDTTMVVDGVAFGGTKRIDGSIVLLDQPCTIFLLWRNNDPTHADYAYAAELTDNGSFERSTVLVDIYGSMSGRRAQADSNVSYSYSSTALLLHRVELSTMGAAIYENGVWKSSTAIPSTARNVTSYRLGLSFAGNKPVDATECAFLVYEGLMSEADTLAIENQLMAMAELATPFDWPIQAATVTTGDPQFILPPTIDALVGYELRFDVDSVGYRDGLVSRSFASDLPIDASLASRRVVVPPTAGTYSFSVTEGAYTASTTITARPVPTSGAKKYVLAFGDSNCQRWRAGLQEYILDILGTSPIEFVGTLGPDAGYRTKNEGRDSWVFGTAAGALGGFDKVGSPFYAGGASLNLASYEAGLSHAPTHMIVCCGQNAAYLATEAALEAALDVEIAAASNIFQAAEAQWPGIKIGLLQSWPLNANPAVWGSWANRLIVRRKMHRLAQRLEELLTEPGVDVSLIPTFFQVGIGVRPYNSWADPLHVSSSGHLQLINPVLGWLAAH